METKDNKLIYWTPRVLAVMITTLLFLMSLDVFSIGMNWLQTILALLLHNIPAFIFLIIMIISWNREIVGGIAFTLGGLLYIIITVSSEGLPWYLKLSWSMILAGPAILTGILFLINWNKKKKKQSKYT